MIVNSRDNGIPELCLPREHNLVKLFKLNFMLFSEEARHVMPREFRRGFLRSGVGGFVFAVFG